MLRGADGEQRASWDSARSSRVRRRRSAGLDFDHPARRQHARARPVPQQHPYQALPPKAIEHAKMIVASTFASAAAGSAIESARILRQLAKEQGGRPEATIWFDGTRVPAVAAARVNAVLSDAAASDDSDIRNTAHEGTTLTAAGLAVGERTGATGQDLLGAMVLGYQAAGRIGEARTRRARRPARLADRRLCRRRVLRRSS